MGAPQLSIGAHVMVGVGTPKQVVGPTLWFIWVDYKTGTPLDSHGSHGLASIWMHWTVGLTVHSFWNLDGESLWDMLSKQKSLWDMDQVGQWWSKHPSWAPGFSWGAWGSLYAYSIIQDNINAYIWKSSTVGLPAPTHLNSILPLVLSTLSLQWFGTHPNLVFIQLYSSIVIMH